MKKQNPAGMPDTITSLKAEFVQLLAECKQLNSKLADNSAVWAELKKKRAECAEKYILHGRLSAICRELVQVARADREARMERKRGREAGEDDDEVEVTKKLKAEFEIEEAFERARSEVREVGVEVETEMEMEMEDAGTDEEAVI